MHLLFELIGLVILCMLFVGLFGLGLAVVGAVGYVETHNPLFILMAVVGVMIIGSLD